MLRVRALIVLGASIFLAILSVAITGVFNGVGFLFVIIAVLSFATFVYISADGPVVMDLDNLDRCSYCHHIRDLNKGVMRQHTYLGSAMCPGSGKPPAEPYKEEEMT